jgi:CCR4-NOT transcription complex subunit 2
MQGYPTMQNHRAQSLVPQPSPGFIQQRTVGANTANAFNFAGNMQQQQQQQQQQAVAQQSTQQQQHQQQQQQQASSLQQQQPQPPHPQSQLQNTATNAVPPHLVQQGTPGLSSATQNNSDVSLDPNDFPALGSGNTPGGTANATSNANLHSSYATQAGTGVPPASVGAVSGPQGAGAGQTSRDFGPDDFPALGGQAQQQQETPQTQEATAVSQQHPPGLNGFQQNDQ